MSKLHELWKELRSSTPSRGLTMRLLHAGQEVRIFAAVSNPGNCEAVVIELPIAHRPKDLSRITTRTFEAILAEFPGLAAASCAISVVLHEPEYVDLFEVLGDEIVLALRSSISTADGCRAVVKCIDRWRRFIEKKSRSMTEEETRGLIGELVVLCRASARLGPHAAIHAWQGPIGSLRDFELPDFSVEVKTYQADTGAAVRINDPQQLESTPDRPVYLCAVRIARAQAQGRTLPDFIAVAEDIVKPDLEASEVFRDRLAAVGYLPSQAEHYRDRYIAAPPEVFQVRHGFPRIRLDQVPGSVKDVHFSIILTGAAPFGVDALKLLGASTCMETE